MKIWSRLMAAIVLFLLLMGISEYLSKPHGLVIDNWVLETEQGAKPIDIPYIQDVREEQIVSFKAQFGRVQADTLVIPRINGYALRVSVNGQLIEELGDFNNPTANIWNYAHAIDLSSVKLTDVNTIELQSYALHDFGLLEHPYLGNKEQVYIYLTLFNIMRNDMHNWVVGAAISFSVLVFALSFKLKAHRQVYRSYSLALMFFAIYNQDYIFRLTAGNETEFLILRKIFLISVYLSLTFLIVAERAYLFGKKTEAFVYYGVGLFILPIVLARDFAGTYRAQNLANLIVFIAVVYAVTLGFLAKRKTMYFSSTFLLITIAHTTANLVFKLSDMFYLQFGVMVYIIGITLSIVLEFAQMEKENQFLGSISKRDALTGVYNRNILHDLGDCYGDTLVFIDVDSFKRYNDTYGHAAGDTLLKSIAMMLQEGVTADDLVVRYGGDEFVLLLRRTDEDAAQFIMKRIQQSIKKLGDDINISYGIKEYDEQILETMIEADNRMYAMKRHK